MKIRLVMCEADALEAREWLMNSILITCDVETIPELILLQVVGYTGLQADGRMRTFVFPLYVSRNPAAGHPMDLGSYIRVIQEVNASGIPFGFHNGPYDLAWLVRYGMPVANYAYDSMTMFWSRYPELPKTLDFVSSVLNDDHVFWKADRKSDDFIKYLEYNGKDCHRTMQCVMRLIEMLIADEQSRRNFDDAHRRVISAFGMSMRGMIADENRLAYHHRKLKQEALRRLEELRYLIADPDFNPNSVPQKSALLYTVLGARPRNAKGRFVKSISEASTGAVPMRAMRSEHPLFRRVVDGIMSASAPAKQISNVIGIRRTPCGRFLTGYKGVGTTTTRLASAETPFTWGSNAQNIRKTYRDWICAEPGCFLLDIDFSAGDDVFVTFESGDPRKIELFRTGKDSHAANATLFFPHWTYEDVVAGKRAGDPRVVHPITGIRQITKKLSHGCNYLMAALTLLMTSGREAIVGAAKELGYADAGIWTQDKLVDFCLSRELLYRGHYTRFARDGVGSWYMDLLREFAATGGFTTPFGYFQRFLGSPGDQNVLRAIAATAGQAGTAGRINLAMDELVHGYIPRRFRDADNPSYGDKPAQISQESHGVSLRLQTHDSFTFNVDPQHPKWEDGIRNVFTSMTRPVVIRNSQTGELESFSVGIESEIGHSWGYGLHEIKKNTLEGLKDKLTQDMLYQPGITYRNREGMVQEYLTQRSERV